MTTAIKEMKPTYRIFVLDSEEYDSLHKHYPMKKEDLEDSLGFAYGKTKEAFIRRTGIPEWDEETIIHEAEELLAKHSSHEDENAIRWKKGKDIFASIIPAILGGIVTVLTGGGAAPFVGPTMASILGGAASAGTSAITQKNMSSSGEINPLGVALSGIGSGLAGSAMMPGVQAASQAGKSFLGQVGGGLLGTAPTASAAGTSGLLGSGGNILGIGTTSLAPTGVATYPAGTPIGVTNTGVSSAFPGGSALGLASAPVSTVPQTLNVGQSILGSALGSGVGSALASAGKTVTPATTPGSINPTMGLPSASGQGLVPSAQSTFGSISPGASVGNINSNLLGNAASSAANLPTVQAPVETVKSGLLSTLGKKAGEFITEPKNILGAGMTLASTMGKQPEFQPVDIESIRTALLSGQAISPLATQARAQLSQIMGAQSGQLYPTATDAYYQSAMRQTEIAYQDAQKAMAKRYNMFDPNYQQNGEYQDLARKLDQELASVKSDYAVKEEQRRFELERQQKYQAIQEALGVDTQTMNELLGFTQLSIQQAADKYQVDVKDVDEMRKALGGLGGELLSSPGGILGK